MAPSESQSLRGQRALITGAGRGIGAATARLFAERGADIVLLDIDAETVNTTAAEIGEKGRSARACVADIAETKACEAAIGAEIGEIDILVNNAGIAGGGEALAEIDEERFDEMMNVHVRGAFFRTRAVVPGIIARGRGRIINVSSNRGLVGFERSSHYCAAKAALLGLTKAWAREFGRHGILVNAVAPGVVSTEMNTQFGMEALEEEASWNLLKRWAEPEKIAYTIAHLASAEGGFITGQVISPNGGDPIVGI